MDYYLQIENDKITKIYGTDWTKNGDNLERKRGANILTVPIEGLQKIIFNKSLKSKYSAKSNYVVESGVARIKTDGELDSEKKPAVKKNAYDLYSEIVLDLMVEANGEKYSFNLLSLLFFLARFTHTNGSGFVWKPKGKDQRQHSRAEVVAIFGAVDSTVQAAFDAYNLDRLNILDNGVFDIANLKAAKAAQDLIKD